MMLIVANIVRSTWYFVFPLTVFTHDIETRSNFCQASGFITQLGPENSGFNLSIMNSTNDANLTYEEQGLIRDTLENSLGGAFDFGLAQGKSLLKQTPLVRDTDVEYLDEYSDIDSDEFSD